MLRPSEPSIVAQSLQKDLISFPFWCINLSFIQINSQRTARIRKVAGYFSSR